MTRLSNATEVRSWLVQLGIERVTVISPHLDDAVFSVAGILSACRDRAEVITVFTEGSAGENDAWARTTGFADSADEHKARRQEDALAMSRLGCGFQHLGCRHDDLDKRSVAQAVDAMTQNRTDGLSRTLVLLPAGAGGPTPSTPLSRLAWRLLRRPWGCMPHGEHELTRDLFWQALSGSQARLGFYAELPYAWSHSNRALKERLHRVLGCHTELVEHRHDISEKTRLVELYSSQLIPIFGPNPAYRRRVLERTECLLMA